MKKVSRSYLIWTIVLCVLAIAINAYIIFHACLDAAQSTQQSNGVVEVAEDTVNTISPGTITPENHDSFATFIRKAFGHFGLFTISGMLTTLALFFACSPYKWYRNYLLIIMSLGFGLLIGITTELIQLNVPGRSGEFLDVLIDFSGYLLGFLLILIILFLIFKDKYKKQKQLVNE